MAEDGAKPVLIGFEGVTAGDPQPSEPPPPAKSEGSEEIQLLTPEEQTVQVRAFKTIDRRASNRDVRKRSQGVSWRVATTEGFASGHALMAPERFVNARMRVPFRGEENYFVAVQRNATR